MHRKALYGLVALYVLFCVVAIAVTVEGSRRSDRHQARLAEEIGSLRSVNEALVRQLDEYTSWNASFRPLTDNLAKNLVAELRAASVPGFGDQPRLRLQCEAGSQPRRLLTQQMAYLMGKAAACDFADGTYMGFMPGAAVEVMCPSNQLSYCAAVLNCLTNVIEGDFRVSGRGAGRDITLHVNGAPMFRVDGRVRFQ